MNAADSIVVMQGGDTPAAAATPTSEPKLLAGFGATVVDVSAQAKQLPSDWPAGANLQSDGTVILTLEYPVRFRLRDANGHESPGASYETLHLKRLKGKHKQRMLDAPIGAAYEKAIIGCSTDLDDGKVNLLYAEMDQADIRAVIRVVNFFLTPGLKTGQAS